MSGICIINTRMSEIEHVGQWLRQQRQSMNISIRELGRRTAIPNTTLSSIEKGMKPSVNVAKQLAQFFRVPEDYVFRLSGILGSEEIRKPTVEAIANESETLPVDEQIGVLEFVRLRRKIVEDKKKKPGKGT